jgi:hypothetical protein
MTVVIVASNASVGGTAGGTEGSASEDVPRPVQLPRPTKTSAPIPEASKPGNTTRVSVAPPIPATSMIRNAPRTGEPSSVLTAATPARARATTRAAGFRAPDSADQ